MTNAANEVLNIFVVAIILGFGLVGFLATSGMLDKWRHRFSKDV